MIAITTSSSTRVKADRTRVMVLSLEFVTKGNPHIEARGHTGGYNAPRHNEPLQRSTSQKAIGVSSSELAPEERKQTAVIAQGIGGGPRAERRSGVRDDAPA